ncbi:unnamed protein product [Microthlaspi erraticum]|uniref:Uncharacterized protein n=1 Tax=Microthlaspi erraticum TaxID=1685480 RepID=A0A6D2KKT8_9BRAS|nr:unnamed protein product [Microthlaspi erraticum]
MRVEMGLKRRVEMKWKKRLELRWKKIMNRRKKKMGCYKGHKTKINTTKGDNSQYKTSMASALHVTHWRILHIKTLAVQKQFRSHKSIQ